MNIATYIRCKVAQDFEQGAKRFKFASEVWTVAAAFVKLPAAGNFLDIMRLTQLGEQEVKESMAELLTGGLIVQEVMSWSDFNLLAKTAPAVVPRVQGVGGIRSSIGTITSIGGMPSATPVVAATAGGFYTDLQNNAADAAGITRMRMGVIAVAQDSAELTKTRVGGVGSVGGDFGTGSTMIGSIGTIGQNRPDQGSASSLPPADGKAYRLRPILAQIEKLCGGGVEGDLLVYQVFLRIPLNLLKAEGISSLHIVDDQTSFDSPALLEAITAATREVTGKALVV